MSLRQRYAATLIILLLAPYATAVQPTSGFVETTITSDTTWDEDAQYAGAITVTVGHTLEIVNSTIAVDFGEMGGALTLVIEQGASLNINNSTLDGSTGDAAISLYPLQTGRLTFNLGVAGQAGTLTLRAPSGENLSDLQARWRGANEAVNLSGESFAITIPSDLSGETDLLIEHINASFGAISRQITSAELQRGTIETNTSADALQSGGQFIIPMPTAFSIIALGELSITNSTLIAMDLRVHGEANLSSTNLRASTPVHVYDQGSFSMIGGKITGCKEYSSSYAAEVVHHGMEATSDVSTEHAATVEEDLCKRSFRVLDTQTVTTTLPGVRMLLSQISPIEESYTLIANSEGTVNIDRGSGYRSIIEWIGPTGEEWKENATFNASWSTDWGVYSLEGDLGTEGSVIIDIPIPAPRVTSITSAAASSNTNSPLSVTISVINEGEVAGIFAIKCTVGGQDAQINPRLPHVTLQANESKDVEVTWRNQQEGSATLDCRIVEPSQGMPTGQSSSASGTSSAAVSFTLEQGALDDTDPTIIILLILLAVVAAAVVGTLIWKGEPPGLDIPEKSLDDSSEEE